jgi:hypothetical protein
MGSFKEFPDEYDVLRLVSELLIQTRIPFMLTGSLAMNFYAEPRMTRDIDLVIGLFPGNISGLVAALDPEFMIVREAVEEAVTREGMFNAIHHESVIKVDFICLKRTDFNQQAFRKRRKITLGDGETYLIGKEDLILSKMAWARESESEVQLRDVRNLIKECDLTYVESWIHELNLQSLWETVKHG